MCASPQHSTHPGARGPRCRKAQWRGAGAGRRGSDLPFIHENSLIKSMMMNYSLLDLWLLNFEVRFGSLLFS